MATDYSRLNSRGTDSGLWEILDAMQALTKRRPNRWAVQMLSEIKEKLAAETFTLVVMGEFKRGKSTLINAFLGAEILPTGILPLTCAPTVIRYGHHPKAWVSFLDGNKQEIPLEDIAFYVTEKENPHNTKEVHQVELDYPLAYLQKGMILVDTPGIGSAYEHNTVVAYNYLPHADAALVLTAVDAPLSKIELEYLRAVRTQVPKMFFALNKIDSITPDELPEVIQFTTDLLRENLNGEEIILFPVSARQALEKKLIYDEERLESSGWHRLEQYIMNMVESGKLDLIRKVAASKGLRIAKQLSVEIQLWQQALESSTADLEIKISGFQVALAGIRRQQEESIHLLYHEVDELGHEVAEDIERLKDTLLPGLKDEFHAYFRDQMRRQTLAREMVELLNTFIQERLQMVLHSWQREYRESINRKFMQTAQRFFDRIEETVEQMLAASAEIFQITYEPMMLKNYIQEQQRFSFHFSEHPTFLPSMENLASLGFIPKRFLGGRFYQNALSKLEELFDRNCGRLRYELAEGLKENARSVAGELRLHADMVANGLEEALKRAQSEKLDSENTKEAILAAESDLTRLRSWESILTSLQ